MQRIEKPKAAAPMPTNEIDIVNNSMKLYAYLVCIGGLATYPENTRMFRQKNLSLTKIKEATGITDKTVKLYLFYLEQRGLIYYTGKYQFPELKREDFENFKDYRIEAMKQSAETWKERNKKEKDAVYHIPRPNPFTPVPEITLEKLNRDFKITELEMDLYLLFCYYRDKCVKYDYSYKGMTYENIRDIFGLKKNSETDAAIFRALTFLSELDLIKFDTGYICNSKLAKIPCFKIKEVNYYIKKSTIEFQNDDLVNDKDIKELKDVMERIKNGFMRQESTKIE